MGDFLVESAQCDYCGKPSQLTPAWAQLELLQYGAPEVQNRALCCPVCVLTIRAMMFTRWLGKRHSPIFQPHVNRDDQEDEADDGDDERDEWGHEPDEAELWELWRTDPLGADDDG